MIDLRVVIYQEELVMKNLELECVPQWRFCSIPWGEKGPRSAGWQRNPQQLKDIDGNNNVGVLLGPSSGGLVALDFDGTTAWSWFADTIDCQLPSTVMWTSGKADRCQMAFQVPEQYWDYVRTQKIATGTGEGFEFRWTGCQSVVPPSQLKDGRTYTWVVGPDTTDIPVLPDAILSYWLELSNPVIEPVDIPDAMPAVTEQEVIDIYTELKRCYPELDYDRWTRATWIITRQLGVNDGLAVMRYLYGEQETGEYDNLLKGQQPNRPASLGSVITWIRQRNPEYKKAKSIDDLKNNIEDSISKLRGKLEKWQQKTQKN